METEGYAERLAEEIIRSTFRCRNCNYCYSQCPLYGSLAGFMVNGPSGIIQAIYYFLKWHLNEEEDKKEILDILYSCSTCNSCVIVCKELSAGIPLVEIIEKGRKFLVDRNIGPLPFQRNVLKSIYQKDNPYNFDPQDRLNWAGGLSVKKLPGDKADVLFYVGCSASYDPLLFNLPRSLVKILLSAEVDFGLLENEACCSCAANRLGDEFLFEEKARKNVRTFLDCGVKEIITLSPHCYNTLVNEYTGLEKVKVRHYTQFINELIRKKKIKFTKKLDYVITYHDPCYLGKRNGIYDEPREILAALPGVRLAEMKDNRKASLCCGGGGGRMWLEIKEEKRLANLRLEQAVAAEAGVVAVACPWCYTMLANAVKDLGKEENLKVKDIAEIVAEALF